ncbi:MAG: nuclear transport factor 2 family protein, partial [Terriglobia bacterium]
MVGPRHFVLTAAVALVFAALAHSANAADTAAMAAPTAAAKHALVALEKSALEAWKSKDAKFWDTFLSDKFVGYGSFGKLDKASATKEYTGADCNIKIYALSDEQVRPLAKDVALLTYKLTQEGTCGGQKIPANSWAASIYVRDGDTWKGAFHAEAPIVDSKMVSAKSADKQEAPQKAEAKPAASDARADMLMAAEKAVWETWKEHDAKKLEHLTARDISFIDDFGNHFATKAETIKDWTGPGCNVRSFSLTDG